MNETLLRGIEKPGRYTGGELNAVQKENPDVRFALCFPDIYEVGMSHLGLQILYEVLNSDEKTAAERVFCPWTDMTARLRGENEPLRSLESGTPLYAFDLVGFSLSYELSYTNVLAMLDLGGIPLLGRERSEKDPIVAAGGQCATNPEPMADFIDLFMIGEGEEVIAELAALRARAKKAGLSRREFLREAARIEGIYVPSLYTVSYNGDGTVKAVQAQEGAPEKVMRRFVSDFENAPTVTRPVVPYLAAVHDRCVLEIMRGCPNGCRFCQAGYITRPVRERSAGQNLRTAKSALAASGWEEIALCSLSSGDHSEIGPLIDGLIETYRDDRVSVSLPSLRVDSFHFGRQMQEVRKRGLTFAPEAGTQRLRDVINKNITEEQILRAASEAFGEGATHIKLYFMIGLPTETTEDLDGIAELVRKIRRLFYEVPKEKRRGRLEIIVSVANFVPKAATPFQWEAQNTMEVLGEKHRYLKEKLRMKGVRFHYHDEKTSLLEAVLARGDRRLGAVLLEAYRRGAMLDSWSEHFSLDRYLDAFTSCGLDPAFYASRRRSTEEILPYAHIDQGVQNDFFLRERAQALNGNTTPPCMRDCAGCGLQASCTLHKCS